MGVETYVDAGPVVLELTDNPRFKWRNWLWNERLFGSKYDEPRLAEALASIVERSEVWGEILRRAGIAATPNESGEQIGWTIEDVSRMRTTLGRIPRRTAVALMRHGYIDAMGGLYTLYGFPLLDIPESKYFDDLLE
jgi:hypothetical protein